MSNAGNYYELNTGSFNHLLEKKIVRNLHIHFKKDKYNFKNQQS